jgi:hypothetical protein
MPFGQEPVCGVTILAWHLCTGIRSGKRACAESSGADTEWKSTSSTAKNGLSLDHQEPEKCSDARQGGFRPLQSSAARPSPVPLRVECEWRGILRYRCAAPTITWPQAVFLKSVDGDTGLVPYRHGSPPLKTPGRRQRSAWFPYSQ